MMAKTDAEKLLPFYLNGTLTADEAENVEQALTEYPELQQELDFLDRLRDQLHRQSEPLNSPGELGLKRLQQQLKKTPEKSGYGWRITAIAASVLLLTQTVVTLQMNDPAVYLPAGGAHDSEIHGTLLSITFAPDASEHQIRAVLLEADSRIVNGPSALGIYQIVIEGESEDTILWLKEQAIIESLQVH